MGAQRGLNPSLLHASQPCHSNDCTAHLLAQLAAVLQVGAAVLDAAHSPLAATDTARIGQQADRRTAASSQLLQRWVRGKRCHISTLDSPGILAGRVPQCCHGPQHGADRRRAPLRHLLDRDQLDGGGVEASLGREQGKVREQGGQVVSIGRNGAGRHASGCKCCGSHCPPHSFTGSRSCTPGSDSTLLLGQAGSVLR